MFSLFFFNDTATTEIYTLSLHDALPIYSFRQAKADMGRADLEYQLRPYVDYYFKNVFSTQTGGTASGSFDAWLTNLDDTAERDRKSTRLNSSHGYISYAVFCLKKKKK